MSISKTFFFFTVSHVVRPMVMQAAKLELSEEKLNREGYTETLELETA